MANSEWRIETKVFTASPIRHSPFRHSLYSYEYSASRNLLHPGFGIAGPIAAAPQRRDEAGHGLQIMDRPEFVDMRQHGLDATGAGLKTFEAQQRVEPDQPPARAVQPIDLEGERVVGVALEPVGDEQDDGALREHPARPTLD